MQRPEPRVDEWDPRDNLLGLVRDLSAIAAPTGNEDRLTAAVESYVSSRGWPVEADHLGQLAVTTGRTTQRPR